MIDPPADPTALPRPIRILVAYVTAGAGHHRAAETIAKALTAAMPDATIECRDLLEETPGWWARGYPWAYYLLVRHLGSVWGTSFELLDHPAVYRLAQPIRRWWNRLMARRGLVGLRAAPPDLIIATHFFPADVIGAWKRLGRLRSPLVVVVTDFHPHRFWLSPDAERYVCATPESARAIQQRGIPADRIAALGIPVSEAFQATFDRSALLTQFGLDPERRTILVTSGGSTVGPFERVVEALAGLEKTRPGLAQLLVVCGEHLAAAKRLERLAGRTAMPVRVFGFIDTMPQAMAASDLIVAKAGGITVTEALVRRVPLVLYHAIPGQERLNAEYLVGRGAAVLVRRPARLVETVCRLFDEPNRVAAMREAAATLSRPHAAADIVEQVVKPLLAGRI